MKTYYKSIVFTLVPLEGYYRYRNIFQIYPANIESIPKSKMQTHFPAIIEYWTDENEVINAPEDYAEFENLLELYSTTATSLIKLDIILNLLTAFTNHLFFRYNDPSGCWGIPENVATDKEKTEDHRSEWIMKLFYWTEMPKFMQISDFTELKLNSVKFDFHLPYFLNNPNIDFDRRKSITLPVTITRALDAYFEKNQEIKSVVDTAISYTVSAVELRNIKKTLSLLASFTALETMVNLEYRNDKSEHCETCGQLKFKVSKKFRDFLSKYISKTKNSKKKFNSYYSLRSKIVHTGQRLETEILFNEVAKETKDMEFLQQYEIIQLGKLSIIHWLLRNN